MEPDDSVRGWNLHFPEDSYDAVVAMCRFWTERGYLCGRISRGDPDAFHELMKFDAGAALLAASVSVDARALAGEDT